MGWEMCVWVSVSVEVGRGFLDESSRASALQGPDSASVYVGEAGVFTITGANAESVGRSSHYAMGQRVLVEAPTMRQALR